MPERRSTGRPTRPARGYADRRVKTRELRQRFLIVCEGGKTEPRYFESFHLNRRVVPVDIRGLGADPLRLVRKAEQLRTEEEYTEAYDQVWVVFDCDDFAAGDINRACSRRAAERHPGGVFEPGLRAVVPAALRLSQHVRCQRRDYIGEAIALLGHPYAKNSATIYRELESRRPRPWPTPDGCWPQYDPPNPAADDPSTTVHELVEQLNRFQV